MYGVSLGGGGKRYSQSRPHPEAMACYPWAREPPAYIGALSPEQRETSKLATARVLCFFPLATPEFILRPHCHLGRYRWQRSQPTRAATLPQCLRQWTRPRSVTDIGIFLDGFFGFRISMYSLVSYYFSCFLLEYDLNELVGLAELDQFLFFHYSTILRQSIPNDSNDNYK